MTDNTALINAILALLVALAEETLGDVSNPTRREYIAELLAKVRELGK